MEYLKREVKSERKECQENMTISLIDGIRLCLRWADKENPEEDIVMNFTQAETDKIIKLLCDFD